MLAQLTLHYHAVCDVMTTKVMTTHIYIIYDMTASRYYFSILLPVVSYLVSSTIFSFLCVSIFVNADEYSCTIENGEYNM